MKSKRGMCARLLLWSLVLLLAAPPGGIMAQSPESGGQMIFRQEELDQMLAPIALYPDELLVQVLMAATYPLEVVRASRWVKANPNLRGDQLAAALEQEDWDPSVKSLANFPSVLQMMNDRLEWTQKLGDAFLAQEEQIMDSVQKLRKKAQAEGRLRTTNEQTVIEDLQSQTIIIEPAVPEVVYVPVYDPTIVYGPWWWPAYPPYYYYPRGGVVGFGFGVAVGVAWGYAWGGFNWHHHDVVINTTRNAHINNRIDRNRYVSHMPPGTGGQGIWRHDPVHRGGVAYRSPSVAQQFGRGPLPGADTRRDLRGFDRSGAGRVVSQQPDRPLGQQLRIAGSPSVTKAEPPRQTIGPTQQPRVATSPGVTKAEPPKQTASPTQQPRVTGSPSVTKAEPPRQTISPTQQPRVAASPGRQGVQGQQSPTAFSGFGPGSQTRQSSNRGNESLSSGRPGGSAPSSKQASPSSGRSEGGTSRGGGPRK